MLNKVLDNLLIEEKIKKLGIEIRQLRNKQHKEISCDVDFNWLVKTDHGWNPYDQITNIKLELLFRNKINNELTYMFRGKKYIINIGTMKQFRYDNPSLVRNIQRLRNI